MMSTSPLRWFAATLFLLMLVSTAWATPKFRVIHQFAGGSDGVYPLNALVIGLSGVLYGATYQGGSGTACGTQIPGCGTAYQLALKSGKWTESVIYNFDSTTVPYTLGAGDRFQWQPLRRL